MFTARRLNSLTSALSLLNRVTLRVIFRTVLSRAQVFTRVVNLIKVSILRHRFGGIQTLINTSAWRLFQLADNSAFQKVHHKVAVRDPADGAFPKVLHEFNN